ncbi:single-stranded DNA-binding protein [Synergistaceae bacterium OttesenSCG-928-D05]|nr:single-stranded DNA-binding protein [Synergistaceae bacterium OttesenSCG-928-D05]
MARGYNRVVLMGNLARDPDVRFTPSKQKVARITVAIGRQWKNKATGELQSHTDFVNVVAWSFLADLCERYLKKGRPVLVEGRISVRDFDDVKTGQHRWVTEVVADNIVLLSSGRRDDEGQTGYSSDQGGQSSYRQPSSDAVTPGDMGSLREEEGFVDEFPLDFSEMNGEGPGDVDIPF